MQTTELIAFAVWCFSLAVAGGAMGLVLGNLRAPASVAIASSPAAGLGANIVISGAAAMVGSIGHLRAGRVDWPLVGWMLLPSLAGGALGALLSTAVPERVLLISISAVLLWNAWSLLRRRPRASPPAGTEQGAAPVKHALAVAIAFGVGLLGGFIGLILGSLRIPAMIRHLRQPPHLVVGTNMVLGAGVALAAMLAHLVNPEGAIDGAIVAVGIIASAPGAVIGARLTGRLSEDQLVKAIGITVAVAGLALLARAAAG